MARIPLQLSSKLAELNKLPTLQNAIEISKDVMDDK